MLDKIKQIKGDSILKFGLLVYAIGFPCLYLVHNDYTGFFSFIAPFAIVLGIILISVGLLK